MSQTLSILKENLQNRMHLFQRLKEQSPRNQLKIAEAVKALERDLLKYDNYGISSQVFHVQLKIRTLNNILQDAHLIYADVKIEEIKELIKRDVKDQEIKEIRVHQIKLGKLLSINNQPLIKH